MSINLSAAPHFDFQQSSDENITTSMFGDYEDQFYSMGNSTNMPNGWISKDSPVYNSERRLYDNILAEVYNLHGVSLDFYVTTYDSNYNFIFGEDNNRRFVRKFSFMGFYTLPKEEKLWSKFGIEGMDTFSIFCSKLHFNDASTFGNPEVPGNKGLGTYSPHIPLIGNIIISDYNKYIYEITEVKEESGMYLLSKQHTWEFVVKPYKDEHMSLSPDTSASMGYISQFVNRKTDIFDVTATLGTLTPNIEYQPGPTEEPDQDPGASTFL